MKKKCCKKRGCIGKFLALAAVSCMVCAVISCKRHGSPEKRAEWVVSKVTKKLDLNKDQQSKLNLLKDQLLEARRQHRDSKRDFMQEVEKLVLAERVELKEVEKLMQSKRELHDRELPKIFPYFQDFHASLSQEQKSKALEAIRKFKYRHGRKHRH